MSQIYFDKLLTFSYGFYFAGLARVWNKGKNKL